MSSVLGNWTPNGGMVSKVLQRPFPVLPASPASPSPSCSYLALHVATCLSSQGEVLLHHAEGWNWPRQKDGIGPGRRMELAQAEGWN